MEACPDPKKRCEELVEPVSSVKVAVLVVTAALLIYYISRALEHLRGSRERFASKRAREIYDHARDVFAAGGDDAPYSAYKNKVPDADAVQYSEVRRLFKKGNMTPYSIESVL